MPSEAESHAEEPLTLKEIVPPDAFAVCTGEATHRHSDSNLGELAERLDLIVWEYDVMREVFTYMSPGIEELIGVSRERLYTEPGLWFRLAHPEDGEWAHAFCVTATTLRQDHDFEYRIVHADGRLLWIRDIVTVVLDDDGNVAGLEGMIVDMTEHKRLEAEASRRAREFETVFSLLKGFYFRLDPAGVILMSSASMAGLPSGPLLHIEGLTVDALLSAPTVESVERGRAAVADGAASYVEEVLNSRESVRRLLEVSVFPLHHGETAVVVRDTTERLSARESEEHYKTQLKALASELERAGDRERRHLAEEIHDRVSQTLAIARMQLLARESEGTCPPELAGIRELVEQAAREARSLTSELAPTGLYELGLAPAIRTLCESLETQHGLRCTVEDRLPERTPIEDDVLAFAFRAVRELLMNVIKHAGSASAEVRIGLDDEMLRVTVRDSGKGAYLNPQAWTPGESGGFGLFSVLERAQALGGDLDLQSRPGAGTIAVLSVPLAAG